MNMLDAFKDAQGALEEQYKQQVIFHFEKMKSVLGDTLKGVFNYQYALIFRELVQRNVKKDLPKAVLMYSINDKTPYVIDEVKLQENARKYAIITIEDAARKIVSKVGELTDMKGSTLNTAGMGIVFSARGKRGADEVHIDQSMIINTSRNGKVFNQWPARIYVNGKLVSEKNYKKL